MKNLLQRARWLILALFIFVQSAFAQDCFPPSTPRSLYDFNVYLDIDHYFTPQGYEEIETFTVDLFPDQVNILTRRVDFKFTSDLPDAKGLTYVDFGDGVHTWELLSWNATMSITYPNDQSRTIRVFKPEHDPVEPIASFGISFASAGKGAEYQYRFPDETLDLTSEKSYSASGCAPPSAGALGWHGGPGAGHAYIRYGAGNEGSMKKPIIFVEGIDFSQGGTINPEKDPVSAEYRTQYGSFGWDVFTTGVGRSYGADYSAFSNYPTYFQQLHELGYDLILLDFEDGATYIQKNAFVLEELIKQVNARKELSGSVEPNIVIGASMGGLVARYALVQMENAGENHCTGTFVSFDSPQKGAHIPMGLQAGAWFLWASGTFDDLWLSLNRPATHQLLIDHFGDAEQQGRVEKVKWGSTSPEGPILEVPDGDYSCLRTTLMAELDAMGYPKSTRNLGISCGSHIGAFQKGLSAGAGIIDARVHANDFGNVMVFDVNAAEGSPGPDKKRVVKMHNNCLDSDAKHSTDESQILFTGALPSKMVGCNWGPFGGGDAPNEYAGYWVKRTGDIPSIDHAPGAFRNDLRTLINLIHQIKKCERISADIIFDHETNDELCFIPAISAMDLNVPMTDESIEAPYTQAQLASLTPFDKVWASKNNLQHVELTPDLGAWILEEIQSLDQNILELPQAAGPEYNFGNKLRTIPRTVVHNDGTMYVNDAGKLEFRNVIEITQNVVHEAWTKSCNADITVEDGGALILGEDKNESIERKAWVHIVNGTTVHIQSGGTLRLAQGSRLLVEAGARLIIDAGAFVDLRTDQDRIEIHGELVLGGEFNFSGLGYWEFYPEHTFTLTGGLFSLTGAAKDQRFIRLVDQTTLQIGANNLELIDGRVDYGANTRITLAEGGRADLTRVTQSIYPITASMDNVIGLLADNPKRIRYHDCAVLGLQKGVDASVATGQTGYIPLKEFFSFRNCTFKGCEIGIQAQNIKGLEIIQSVFDGQGLVPTPFASPGRYGIHITNMTAAWINGSTFQDYIDFGRTDLPTEDMAAIYIKNVKQLRTYATTVDENTLGILSPANSRSNVFLYAGSTISNNQIGVWMRNGGIDPQGLDYGIVLMDCSNLINNQYGIKGWDVLLQIDALMNGGNMQGLVAPNTFEKGPDGVLLFDICYLYRYNIQTVFARGNNWNPLPVSADWHLYNTGGQGSTCSDQPSNVTLDTDQPITDQTLLGRYCPGDPRDPESDDEPADPNGCLTCLIVNPMDVACSSWPESAVTGTISEVFHNAWQDWYVEDYPTALDGFAELTQGSDAWRDGLDAQCGHYVDVARIFSPKSTDDGQARLANGSVLVDRNDTFQTQNLADRAPTVIAVILTPNPSTGQVTLQGCPIGNNLQVVVFDLTGGVRYQSTLQNGGQMDLSSLTDGQYLVRVLNLDKGEHQTVQVQIHH